MKQYIVVVGGYGHVGQTICKELADSFPGEVYAAGRSLERARKFSDTTKGKVRPLQLDISRPVEPEFWEQVKLVVMCLDQSDLSFVRSCLEQGIHYVDISADFRFLSKVHALHQEAGSRGATAVLSVGLAPGMTNLMAKHAKRFVDEAQMIDISVMLGIGDQHGKAAIEWTVEHLANPFTNKQGESPKKIRSFSDGKIIDFGHHLGRKKAYRFNFSDQHTLPQTLDVPSVSTRLCFDSPLVTKALSMMQASRVLALLRFSPVRNTVVQWFGRVKWGTDQFAVKIDVTGTNNGDTATAECFLQGHIEADMTARVASAVAKIVYSDTLPTGVFHIDQVLDLESILPLIQPGISIDTRINGCSFL